jgi:DNA primase
VLLIDLAIQIGLQPKKVASTQGGEYHSACPSCGGKDRFFIQPNRKMQNCFGYYCCRQCEISGDAIQFCRDFLGLSYKEAAERFQATVPARSFFRSKSNMIKEYRPVQLKLPTDRWLERVKTVVEESHKQMLLKPEILEYLNKRGIPLEAVRRYKIGWNNKDIWSAKNDWGMEGEDGKFIWLPKGILIPAADPGGRILRLKIRRSEWKESDEFTKYVAVSGSMNGLSIIGDTKRTVMIVVESELDAYAIHNAVDSFAFVVAVGSNIKNPDNVTDHLAKKTLALLICHDNDEGGKIMLEKWKKLYRNADGTPVPDGKDVGEYIEAGGDIVLFFKNLLERKKCE